MMESGLQTGEMPNVTKGKRAWETAGDTDGRVSGVVFHHSPLRIPS
jgi:hypothetical protein